MLSLLDNIRTVASIFDASPSNLDPKRNISLDIAEALRWAGGTASIQTIHAPSVSIQLARGLIGSQPAAIFAADTRALTKDLLNSAAFYAYHASIPWGVIGAKDGALIFNSHWIRENDWFHLPLISWSELESNRIIFEAVTPDGVSHERIDNLAKSVYEPDRLLLPVDEMLVERLDHWRTQTLRYSRQVANVDASLQTLFAQFFVLRAVEDRGLAPSLPPLSSVCTPTGRIYLSELRHLLMRAQTDIGSELFEIDALQFVPETVLCGIIEDLYVPHGLPQGGLRYNFSWIDADVLGLAYEKYLSTVLSPTARPLQMSLFDQPLREVERVTVRKSSGAYYTPKYLVQYLTERCLDKIDIKADSGRLPRVVDFACGSGSFLVAAVDSLIRRLREQQPDRNWAREIIAGKHIIGVDIDERAVTMARLALWLRIAEEPRPLPLPRLEEIIICGDSLNKEIWASIPDSYDVVLGNPPFLATGHVSPQEELSLRFKTAQGRYDYSYLFIELSIRHLASKGVLGMVVPNHIFRNRDASLIRQVLVDDTDLVEVIDFGSNEVFQGVSAYIGAIVCQKNDEPGKSSSQEVRVIHVSDISPNFLAAMLLDASIGRHDVRTRSVVAYNSPEPRSGAQWLLLSGTAQHARNRLENGSVPLSEVAGIYQGIRTGANDVFIVRVDVIGDGILSQITNGFEEQGIIETELLRPVVYGSDIQRYEVISTNRSLIYPYRNNMPISEIELKEHYRGTYDYLSRYRDLLASRSSLESSGLRWYELVRKRDETWLQSPKLLIRDLATKPSFALDTTGSMFIVGGTAVVPSESSFLLPLLAYLNSNLVNQYLAQITPVFRSGFKKFEPQHLQQLPVLEAVLHDSELAQKLSSRVTQILGARQAGNETLLLSHETEVNQMLWRIAGIEAEELM